MSLSNLLTRTLLAGLCVCWGDGSFRVSTVGVGAKIDEKWAKSADILSYVNYPMGLKCLHGSYPPDARLGSMTPLALDAAQASRSKLSSGAWVQVGSGSIRS